MQRIPRNYNPTGKSKGQNKRTTSKNKPSVFTIGDTASYKGQQRSTLMLPAVISPFTTTVTTGVIASATAINTSSINGFATRFGSTFDEYRILKVKAKVRPLASTSGITRFWFDEKSSSAPTATDSTERVGVSASNNSADDKSCFTMTWSARDLLDLQYTAIGSTSTPVYFKMYTDSATYGAPATVTMLWLVEFDFLIEFRGLKAA